MPVLARPCYVYLWAIPWEHAGSFTISVLWDSKNIKAAIFHHIGSGGRSLVKEA